LKAAAAQQVPSQRRDWRIVVECVSPDTSLRDAARKMREVVDCSPAEEVELARELIAGRDLPL
jgi:hypothetical protein